MPIATYGYFVSGAAITPGGPSIWYALDWDQRRVIAVTMDEEQHCEDLAFKHLERHMDDLGLDVYAIHVSQDGDLISVSTDPADDQTTWAYFPPLEALRACLPDHISLNVVRRSDLLELERIQPNVDLVSYTSDDANAPASKGVFKYYFIAQFIDKRWHEMNLWLRLPPHPHIVPFDRVVVDEVAGRVVVGFTSVYIPGGTIEANTSRTFKLAWLRQLTSVIDDLNLKHGIAHQDVAARNLLVDPATDALLLFDFNFIGRIGGVGHVECRDDVKGVAFTLYEIITRDEHFRSVPHEQQDVADVQALEEWVQHPDVKLDHAVEEYRAVLDEWVEQRRQGKQVEVHTETPECIDWPFVPKPPPTEMTFSDMLGNPSVVKWVILSSTLQAARERGEIVLNWQRPAEKKLREGDRVLSTGQLVSR